MEEKIHIRKGVRRDIPAIHHLIKELAVYERAESEVHTTVAQMEQDGFGKKPLFEFFVAETGEGEVVGIALFYFGYSTWKGKKLYLDDLIVTQAYRRHGIGQMLLDRLVAYAVEQDACQIRWHVLEWNEPAIKFYEKLGVEFDNEWVTCKMSKEKILDYEKKRLSKVSSN